jgi:hypothetical protein
MRPRSGGLTSLLETVLLDELILYCNLCRKEEIMSKQVMKLGFPHGLLCDNRYQT